MSNSRPELPLSGQQNCQILENESHRKLLLYILNVLHVNKIIAFRTEVKNDPYSPQKWITL